MSYELESATSKLKDSSEKTYENFKQNFNLDIPPSSPQQTALLTLIAIQQLSSIDEKDIHITHQYIDDLIQRVNLEKNQILLTKAKKSFPRETTATVQRQDQLAEELYLIGTITAKSRKAPVFPINKKTKKALQNLTENMEKLFQSLDVLQSLHSKVIGKGYIVTNTKSINSTKLYAILSYENPFIDTIHGYSQIKIPYYQMQHRAPQNMTTFKERSDVHPFNQEEDNENVANKLTPWQRILVEARDSRDARINVIQSNQALPLKEEI